MEQYNFIDNCEANYWGITQIQVVKFTYKWTISDYEFCCYNNCKPIISPKFSVIPHSRVKWTLQLYPAGDSKEDADYVSLHLRIHCHNEINPVKVHGEIFILNKNGQEACVAKITKMFNPVREFKISKYIKSDFLKNEANGLLSNGCLTLICKLCTSTNDINHINESNATELKISKHTLMHDFELLYSSKDLSDIQLNSCGQIFHAHKLLLAARSPVFAAMFKHDMKEKEQNIVDIPDIQPRVMEAVLKYVYTEKVDNICTMAKDLMAAAEKYALDGLKTMCEAALVEILSLKNAFEMLILADKYSASYLKKQVILYISSHSEDLVDQVEFKSLETTHPYLAIQILRSIVSKQKL